MTKETKDRIAREAETKFPRTEKASKELTTRVWAEQRGYIAGAEAEATRAQGLVECLNSIKAIGHPDERVLNLIVLTLTKYNNRANP